MTLLYLRLHQKLDETRLDALQFFGTAYLWRFNKRLSSDSDYVQWLLHGVIPPYVAAYVDFLDGEQSCSKTSNT